MKPISDVRVVKTTESAFIKPFSLLFKQVDAYFIYFHNIILINGIKVYMFFLFREKRKLSGT